MRRYFCLFILFTTSTFYLNAAETVLSGVNKSYAGKNISLKSYNDQIVRKERTIATVQVDTSGYFSFIIDIQYPIQAFIPMDLYNGFIYLEPGKEYQIKLPDYTEKSLPQKLDPYFIPKDYLLEIENLHRGDFNFQMMEFEEAFDYFSMKHLVYGAEEDSIKASIQQMRNIFSDLTNEFQTQFMEYRFLLLTNLSPQSSPDSILSRFNQIGADIDNPAFWDAFNNIFSDFIRQSGDNREDNLFFHKIINDGNAKLLFGMIANRYKIENQNLRELIAIKWIYDLVNTNDFDKFKIIALLQKLGGGIQTEQNRELLTAVIKKATVNFIGTKAPDFIATDIQNKEHFLHEYEGKYIYLNFCNSQIDQTQKDLSVLLRFHESYKKELIIINVFLYDTPEQISRIAEPFKDKMQFWYMKDSDSIKEIYDIKNIPSFFLLDKNGNFLISKGTEPNDELRVLLQHIINN